MIAGGEAEAATEGAQEQQAVQLEIAEVAQPAEVTAAAEEAAPAAVTAEEVAPAPAQAPAVVPEPLPETVVETAPATSEVTEAAMEAPAVEAEVLSIEPAPQSTELAPQPQAEEAQPAPVPAPAPIPAPVPATAAPAAPAAAIASVAQAPMQIDHLREILAAAGLTLAVTDPDKLRAAQEAAAKVVHPPRVPRERKPLPPVSNEPLIQVETRR